MTQTLKTSLRRTLSLTASLLAAGTFAATTLHAAVPNRLRADVSLSSLSELPQGVSKRVANAATLGHLNGSTPMQSMSLVLAPTAAQSAALDALLAAQQDPASSSYRQWLTPTQFGAQFGISDADLAVLTGWLTSQGFQVGAIAPSRNQIQFSGTAAAVEAAFHTTMSSFHGTTQDFFENSTAPQVPAAFAGVIGGIGGLSSFRMQPHAAKKQFVGDTKSGLAPQFTSASSGKHYLSPYDIRQIYDANTLNGQGFNGTGIKIGVIGQSAVSTTQLADFQALTGQTAAAPTLVLVPNTGTSTLYAGDEGESESDLEYSSGVAPGASIQFIYSGSSSTADVITALDYAITNNLAPILSLSYGGCEPSYASSIQTSEPFMKQANAQGQTIVVSSGDSGAAGCDDDTSATAFDGLQVGYPATSPYVTAVGGTEFNEGTGTYWNATNNTMAGSALGYIPEMVWNDTAATGALASSTGGASRLFGKPSWQSGTGVPADGARDVPDVAFAASNAHDPYLLCTADTSFTSTSNGTTVTGNCTTTVFGAYAVGGTSLATPSFAGLLAIMEQASKSTFGNINPLLYSMAKTAPLAFHDVTVGNNNVPCAAGTIGCVNGQLGFPATTGYDLATGLGSIDTGVFYASLAAPLAATRTTPTVELFILSSTTTTTTYQATVSSNTSATVPTGTIAFTVDSGTATSVTLAGGVATFTVTPSTLATGNHTVAATYSGDGNFGAASASTTLATSTVSGSLLVAVAPGTLTVTSGTTGTLTVNLTSNAGYSGLVTYALALASGSASPSGCFIGQGDLGISAGSTVSTTLTYHSNGSDAACLTSGLKIAPAAKTNTAKLAEPVPRTPAPYLALVGITGLLGSLCMRRRRVWMTGLLGLAFTAGVLSVSGCGTNNTSGPTGSTSTTTTTVSTGTFNLVLTATSYPVTNVVATTTFSIVVH